MEMEAARSGLLAIDGGFPVRDAEFPFWPIFAQDEIDAVQDVLRSGKVNYWTGIETRQFEKEFAWFCNTQYAVAMANGTLALEMALKALGVGHGDEVIVTPRSFFASASAIIVQGAKAVFADVDQHSKHNRRNHCPAHHLSDQGDHRRAPCRHAL